VINRNLLSKFNPRSFKVLTTKAKLPANIEQIQDTDIKRIFRSFYFSSRLNYYLSNMQVNKAVREAVKLAEREKPAVIVGVFPDYYFLKIARETAKITGIPLAAYLHDTISESHYETRYSREADILQEQVFNEASAIFVMSRGMAELYKKKYNLDSMPLEHTYLEPVLDTVPDNTLKRQAFWGGDIYAINKNAVSRISEGLKTINCDFFLATGASLEGLSSMGIEGSHIKRGFFSKRPEYLANLRENGLLILALDSADESPVHRDELATIFPTKTPEYLAAGSPILIHCPDDYFLARFFKDNNCGYVISEKSPAKIAEISRQMLEEPEAFSEMRLNALKAAGIFDSERLAKKFSTVVNKVSELAWGKKLEVNGLN
jgi:glycosyltransferase involved in cell wall biosynthesis